MHEKLRKKAVKKVEAKKAWFVVASIFGSIALILFVISLNFSGMVFFWINFPSLILALILGIMYMAIFGAPFTGMTAEEWEESEIQKEMARLYRKQGMGLPSPEDLSEEDELELKELARLKQKWDYREEDFV